MRPPSELIRNVLYVGKAQPYAALRAAGMLAVVNLARRTYDGERLHLPIHDGPETVERLIDVVDAVRDLVACGDVPVYLHCAAGHSRSPTVAALYLLRYTTLKDQRGGDRWQSFGDALAFVKTKHRSTRPNDRIIAAAQAVARVWGKEP